MRWLGLLLMIPLGLVGLLLIYAMVTQESARIAMGIILIFVGSVVAFFKGLELLG